MSTANKITLVNDRVERAKSFLLSQFKDKPNINALVESLVAELQELENVINDLQTARTVDGAYGWWLDQIGAELDISRGNYNDNDYKTAIKIAMAKQSASATIDDILRIVGLLTNDSTAELRNHSQYLLELYSYLFCVSESYDGLYSLAQLFPLNTRIRMVKHDTNPITFNVAGKGIGSKLSNLIYHRYGHSEDPRFVTTPTQDIPFPVTSAPTIVSNPYIFGTASVGNVVTLVNGVYDGDDPLTITNQWLRNGADISGATGNIYTLVSADAGTNISCKQTITNAYGSIVSYSNSIAISAVIPPASPFTNDLGLVADHLTTRNTTAGTSVTNTSTLKFKSDGTVQYIQNGTVGLTVNYLVNTGTGLGADYTLTYSVLSGVELTGLNQNSPYVLSSDLSLSLSVTGSNYISKSGEYLFTIYKTSDNTVVETAQIYISTEITSEL